MQKVDHHGQVTHNGEVNPISAVTHSVKVDRLCLNTHYR
jgi:hypothetical protein